MKRSNFSFLIIALFALLSFTACEEQTPAEKAAEKVEETSEEIGDLFRTEREELRYDIEEAQKELDEDIEALQAKLADASKDAKEGINEELAELNAKRKALGEDMQNLGNQISENWAEFKNDVKRRIDEIDEDFEDGLNESM